MTIHKIAKVETLSDDLTEIFQRLGAGPDFLKSLCCEHRREADLLVRDCLTAAEAEKLRGIYAKDFERLGYSTDLPIEPQ